MNIEGIATLIKQKIAEQVFPGAVVVIVGRSGVIYRGAFGSRMITPKRAPMLPDTLFDLASLTKPIVIGTLSMRLVEGGKLSLEEPVRTYLPAFQHPQITCEQLLVHTSGLPAWKPLYLETTSPDAVVEYLGTLPLEAVPGEQVIYSCLGYILMGKLLSAVTGEALDALAENVIFEPLGMRRTGYNPELGAHDSCAAMEDVQSFERSMVHAGEGVRAGAGYIWRAGVFLGEVHDENAHYLGGVSGNAGLFSDGGDLATFCQMLLRHGGEFLSLASVRALAASRTPLGVAEQRSIGWHILADGSLYHTGFTGTSIRIDLEKGVAAVLLTHRVQSDGGRAGIVACRAAFHRSVFG